MHNVIIERIIEVIRDMEYSGIGLEDITLEEIEQWAIEKRAFWKYEQDREYDNDTGI